MARFEVEIEMIAITLMAVEAENAVAAQEVALNQMSNHPANETRFNVHIQQGVS